MKPLFALALLFASWSVSADAYEEGKITKLIVEGNHKVSVWLSGQDNTNDCSSGSRWTIDSNTDKLFKEKYSALLAAYSAQQTVTLRHLTSNGCGFFNGNKIYQVQLKS